MVVVMVVLVVMTMIVVVVVVVFVVKSVAGFSVEEVFLQGWVLNLGLGLLFPMVVSMASAAST